MCFVPCVEIIYRPATLYLLDTVNRLLTFGHETVDTMGGKNHSRHRNGERSLSVKKIPINRWTAT